MNTLPLVLSLALSTASACPTGGPSSHALSKKEEAQLKKELKALKPEKRSVASTGFPGLPTAGMPTAWGGPNPSLWRAEAILANAFSAGLNEGWQWNGIKDVYVSAPVQFQFTGERVYGDGQTNTELSFGSWTEKEPPVIAILAVMRDGRRHVTFKFSKKLPLKNPQISVISSPGIAGSPVRTDVVKLAIGADAVRGEWDAPNGLQFGDLQTARVFWVKPDGWDSAFPFDFRQPVFSVPQLLNAAGASKTAGQSVLDPLGIYRKSQQLHQVSKLTLTNETYGPEWFRDEHGQVHLRNEPIHGAIHPNGGNVPTAVGGGDTWFVPQGPGSAFKNLYTCFDQRNPAKEAVAGVPSGGGWHEIGDAAETIVNDLENAPIPVGFGTGMPFASPPAGLTFAYDLTDVATMRLLLPGEGLMTPAGKRTWSEDATFRQTQHHDWGPRGLDRNARADRNYHWFIFPANVPVCTQEWVHNCVPTYANQLGLACAPAP